VGDYAQTIGATFPVGADGSYEQVVGATFPIGADESYEQVVGRVFGVDSTDTYHTRVHDFVQRAGPSHVGDVTGRIYGAGIHNGRAVTLSKVEYATSFLGAYQEITPITTDPDYSFPVTAIQLGASFKIPVAIAEYVANTIWIRLTVNFTGIGDDVDTDGAFGWAAPDPLIDPPAHLTVPAFSLIGNYSILWTPVLGATGYRLQEAGDSTFAGATEIYDGVAPSTPPLTRGEGIYYYRVQAYHPLAASGWRAGDNGCQVEFDTLKVSPDLGWDNRGDMTDPFKNSNLVRVDPGDLSVSSETPNGYVGPHRRAIAISGASKDIPLAAVRSLLANKQVHYYQFGYLGTVGEFVLLLDAPPVEDEEERP
jgi:hypothetical protein